LLLPIIETDESEEFAWQTTVHQLTWRQDVESLIRRGPGKGR